MKSNQEFLEEFVEDVKIRGWSEWPIKSCQYSANMFFDQTGKSCLEVEITDLKKFLTFLRSRPGHKGKKQVSPLTIKKHFDNLASFFEYLEFEEYIVRSPVPKFRRRYLSNLIKNGGNSPRRQLISVEQMGNLINSILDPQEKAIVSLLAKTGVRVAELIAIDIDDVDWTRFSIKLKPTGKRSNLVIYFDNECGKVLRSWLNVRGEFVSESEPALFVNTKKGKRVTHRIINLLVKTHAEKMGFHEDDAPDLSKRFTPHCCRHWFTTHLRRAGMPREYIKELRGDSRNETMDIYDHIDEEELRRSYIAHIPQLGL